jgi:hypothetical protein
MWRKIRLLILGLAAASAACADDPTPSVAFETVCDGGVCTVCTQCKVDSPDPTPTASPTPTTSPSPTPEPTATPPTTPTPTPTPFPSPSAAPFWSSLTGDALRKSCQNPPEYPENAGETCTNQAGWGRWLMCHRKNVVDNPYKGCTKCRRFPQWVKDRCAGISKDEPEKKIKCFVENMPAWLGQGMEICDETSKCLMDLVGELGWDCHREASDTHAFVVCTINGTRHVFDGNNGAYYTCK